MVRAGVVVGMWVVLGVQALAVCDYHDVSPFRALAEEVLNSDFIAI
jgi:hypothetical protein